LQREFKKGRRNLYIYCVINKVKSGWGIHDSE
jgi:hypothetical protein